MHCMEEQLRELRALASKAENRLTETGIPRVAMVQGKIPAHELSAVCEPMVNLILRGSKSITVGERTLHYDPATYFVMSIDLPAVGEVRPASTGEPYLAVALTLEPIILATLLQDLPESAGTGKPGERPAAGFSVAEATSEVMDAWVRMLRLTNKPSGIAALAPAYEREILYRVLQGPHGGMLREIASSDSAMARVSLAIQWIRRDFALQRRVEDLAEKAAMSCVGFSRSLQGGDCAEPGPVRMALSASSATPAASTSSRTEAGSIRCSGWVQHVPDPATSAGHEAVNPSRRDGSSRRRLDRRR